MCCNINLVGCAKSGLDLPGQQVHWKNINRASGIYELQEGHIAAIILDFDKTGWTNPYQAPEHHRARALRYDPSTPLADVPPAGFVLPQAAGSTTIHLAKTHLGSAMLSQRASRL